MARRIENPTAGKNVVIDSDMFISLIRAGYTFVDDSENNSLILRQNILDTPISNIGVERIKPTRFPQVINKVKEFAQNRKKNANEIADWILTQTDKVVKKLLPTKIQELIELSKRSLYNSKKMYW